MLYIERFYIFIFNALICFLNSNSRKWESSVRISISLSFFLTSPLFGKFLYILLVSSCIVSSPLSSIPIIAKSTRVTRRSSYISKSPSNELVHFQYFFDTSLLIHCICGTSSRNQSLTNKSAWLKNDSTHWIGTQLVGGIHIYDGKWIVPEFPSSFINLQSSSEILLCIPFHISLSL